MQDLLSGGKMTKLQHRVHVLRPSRPYMVFINSYQNLNHLLPVSTSCIDLIFTNQSNLVVDSGTHSSLNPKCNHNITYCKLNLNINYSLLYQRLFSDYKKANVKSIKRSIPANIRLDEDVLKTSYIFVFRRRLEDVLKTSWSRRICSP